MLASCATSSWDRSIPSSSKMVHDITLALRNPNPRANDTEDTMLLRPNLSPLSLGYRWFHSIPTKVLGSTCERKNPLIKRMPNMKIHIELTSLISRTLRGGRSMFFFFKVAMALAIIICKFMQP